MPKSFRAPPGAVSSAAHMAITSLGSFVINPQALGLNGTFFAFCANSTLSQYFLDPSPGLVFVQTHTGKHSLFHLFFPRTPQLFVYLLDVFT